MKKYYYGLAKADCGTVTRFICKNPQRIPSNNIKLLETECDSTEIEPLAEKVLFDYYSNKLEIKLDHNKDIGIFSGTVAFYIDDFHHTCLVLDYAEPHSKMLLITSSPFWNRYSRKITEEENMLLGFPSRGKISYFAPVIRSSSNISLPRAQFPDHRIKELVNEFKIFDPKI